MPLSLAAARVKLKDLAICLALGNLGFLERWYDLEQTHARSINYFREGPADQTLLISTLIASTLLGLVFWLLWLAVQTWGGERLRLLARCGFLALLILCLEPTRQLAAHKGVQPIWSLLSGLEIVLVVGLGLAASGNYMVLRAARIATYSLIFLLPGVLVDFIWFHPGSEPVSSFLPEPSAPVLSPRATSSGKPAPRLVWMIFDELDQRIAFDARPDSVHMPELDRLRAESVIANHVSQVANMTDLAIPTLLMGHPLVSAKLEGANTVLVQPAGSSVWADLKEGPNIFRRVRALGVNTAIAGWHFPYCRMYGDDVTHCMATSGGVPEALRPERQAAALGVLRTVSFLFQLRWAALTGLADANGKDREQEILASQAQRRQLAQFKLIHSRAMADALDQRIGMLFVHFPTPHPFAIYDRERGDFSVRDDNSYLDNLALVDRTVGNMRRALEAGGLWDSTTLLISGDHGLRPSMWRGGYNWTPEIEQMSGDASANVPFILKLAGTSKGAVYDEPFSSLLSGDVALAVLSGEVSTEEQMLQWIARRASIASTSAQ